MFITFEGIDGSGKTTQLKLLAERLTSVVTLKHPSKWVYDIFRLLKSPGAAVREMLYCTDIIYSSESIIVPQLVARRKTILCDRYYDSTRVYQGSQLLSYRDDIMAPNLTIWLDVPVDEAFRRKPSIEYSRDFLEKVRKRYEALVDDRVRRVNGCGSMDEVMERIWKIISHEMKRSLIFFN